jgi:hypothetical protein
MSSTNENSKFDATDGNLTADPDWCEAKPAVIPEPTYWPMILALGITICLWGTLTSWVFVVTGLLLSVLSACCWVMEMR